MGLVAMIIKFPKHVIVNLHTNLILQKQVDLVVDEMPAGPKWIALEQIWLQHLSMLLSMLDFATTN